MPPHPEWLTAATHVVARTWPGWQVRWAFDGVRELADHVDLTGVDLVAAHTYEDPFGGDRPQPPEQPDDPIDCLVTVRHPDGGVTAHPVGHPDQQSLLSRGPALVEALPAALDRRRLPVPVPLTALHVDVPARHVAVWGYEHPRSAKTWWPGWQVDFRADRYAEQNKACGLSVSRPLTPDWAYAALRCHLTGEDGSAVAAIAPHITNYYGTFFQADGEWRYTSQERAAALYAIDAARAESSTRPVHGGLS